MLSRVRTHINRFYGWPCRQTQFSTSLEIFHSLTLNRAIRLGPQIRVYSVPSKNVTKNSNLEPVVQSKRHELWYWLERFEPKSKTKAHFSPLLRRLSLIPNTAERTEKCDQVLRILRQHESKFGTTGAEYYALFEVYTTLRLPTLAVSNFREMQRIGLKMSVKAYADLITILGKRNSKEALELKTEMIKAGLSPNADVYHYDQKRKKNQEKKGI
ncbi:hypothetical protein K7432_013679 [Basidiobolus ranarum]|uniref:Pentatricopeptide repeat-containing protein n=1 Tax=Basidiobolus ranarum TaxID=34480 RepID=A0ABR2WIW8_9FUNG